MVQIYVDLDGTLADFDQHYEDLFGIRPDKVADNVDWEKVKSKKDFYAHIPQMEDMHTLWTFVLRCQEHPIILTGVPRASSVPEAPFNKRDWVDRHLGRHVEVITCRSAEKSKFCKPGDILIDDWTKYQKKWEEAGGIFVRHKSAEESVIKLTKLIREGLCPWTG